MPLTARGEPHKVQKGHYLDISTDIVEGEEDPWTNTPWGVQTDFPDQPQEPQQTRKLVLTKTHPTTSQSSNSVFASSSTEALQETEPDWSSGDTALEIHFQMKPGKHAFQKACRDMYAFVTSAASNARKEVPERQTSLEERKQFDPANQKEIKNCVVNEVLEKLESHEKPTQRAF